MVAVGLLGLPSGAATGAGAEGKSTAGLGLERFYDYASEPTGAGTEHLVNLASGNSLLRWRPFSSPGRGLATVVGLTYNSLEEHSKSPVGNNFSLSVSSLARFGEPITIHPRKIEETTDTSNAWIEFVDGDGTTHRFRRNGGGGWDSPPGVHLYLRRLSGADPRKAWAFTRPDRTTFFFDADGYQTSVEDRNGNAISFVYEDTPPGEDPGGPKRRIVRVTDAAGVGVNPAPNRSFRIEYYAKDDIKKAHVRGKVRRIVDHTGSVLEFGYYKDGNLLRLTQHGGPLPDGSVLPDRSLVLTYTNSSGSGAAIPTAFARANPSPDTPNQSTRLFSVRDPRGAETIFTYYGPGSSQLRWRLASRTNRAGERMSFGYDLDNRTTTIEAPLARTSVHAHDPDGKLVRRVNPKGETTQVAWSGDFHVVNVTEPTGVSTSFAYNDNGYLTDRWDQLGNRTTLVYDNKPVDGRDVAAAWKTGRSTPHLSDLVARTEPNGNATAEPDDFTWRFGYDNRGNLLTAEDPEGGTTEQVFNPDGTVHRMTDANHHTTEFQSYDANGLATVVRDAAGRLTRFGFDDDGLLRWIQDPLHADASGPEPRHYRTYLDYDAFHRQVRQSTPKSTQLEPGQLIWTATSYDANDNVVTDEGPSYGTTGPGDGARSRSAYDAMDRPVLTTGPDTSADPAGERTAIAYDAAGRVSRVTEPKGVPTPSDDDYATFYTYDLLDRVVRETRHLTDTNGAITDSLHTHYCYDLAGDLRSVTAPKAGLTSLDCPAAGVPFTTRSDYDGAHRLVREVDANGNARAAEYDPNGNVVRATNANGATATYMYDERNLPVTQTVPLSDTRSITTKVEYDDVGNPKRLISPRAWDASPDKLIFDQFVTTNHYDALDRLVRVDLPTSADFPEQHYLHHSYDPNGNLTATSLAVTESDPTVVPADLKTQLEVFDTGWIRTSRDPGNPRVHFDYTPEGWQASRTPERNGAPDVARRMTWNYYRDGQRRSVVDSGGQPVTFDYDANNNLVGATDESGVDTSGNSNVEVQVLHDTLNRVTKVRERKRIEPNWHVTTFAYDRNSNITERTDNGEEADSGALLEVGRHHRYVYDEANWLREHVNGGTDVGPADDQRTTLDFIDEGWESVREVANWDSATSSWATQQRTTFDHFDNGLVKTITTRNGAGDLLEQHEVSYVDDEDRFVNGNRASDTFSRRGPPGSSLPCSASACTAKYHYDARERVVKEENGHGGTTSYKMDPVGNVLTETSPTGTTDYAYTGNQLDSVTTAGTTVRHWHDEFGNLDCITTDAGTAADCNDPSPSDRLLTDHAYDYLSRLVASASYSGGTEQSSVDYIYDALDRTVEQREERKNEDTRLRRFNYVGLTDNLGTEEEYNEGGALQKTKTYGYDPFGRRNSMAVACTVPDADVCQGGANDRFTYGYDSHPSVSLLTEATGAVRATYGYTAYGSLDKDLTKGDEDEDDPLNTFRYTGKRFDAASNTIDMGARRFDADPKRFLQADVLNNALNNLGLSLDPLTQNRYSLAGGNPLNFIEWDGHLPGWAHVALDIAGFVPLIGDAVDLIHGGIYVAEGNHVDAALTFGAAVPVFGGAATAAKYGKKAAGITKQVVSHADETVDLASDLTKSSKGAADTLTTGTKSSGGAANVGGQVSKQGSNVATAAPRTPKPIALIGPAGNPGGLRLADHHVMPQKFRPFFESRGINIDEFTVSIPHVTTHLRGVHGRGLHGTPGRWNNRWADWISMNPKATALDIYQFTGRMMDEFRLSGFPIHPYRKGF